ncbi:MAG TPA: glycosyltransferase family 39 protein [Planctomycetota bacterium]|nr:glycosyltransferase family 39 protein [Planctomycetota bacterium]
MISARAAAFVLLPLLCGLSFFRAADRPGLLEKDEPRYAVTAREMARSGDWLVPRFAGQVRLEKPPGAYWAQAAAFKATGRFDERSARLPSAIAASLLVLLVAAGVGRALGAGAGLTAGAALATTAMCVASARLATTDMLHALLFCASAAAWVPVLDGSPRATRWILLSGLLAGGAALVKTPLALCLPPIAAVATAFVLRRLGGDDAMPVPFRRGWSLKVLLPWAGAVAIAAACLLAWYLPCNAETGGALHKSLKSELLSRAAPDKGLHTQPPWYFAGVAIAGLLPWTFLVPAGIAAAWRAARAPGPGRVLGVYAAVLGLTVLLFFSALPSKLPNYILPLVPCAAVLCGFAIHGWNAEGVPRWTRLLAGWGSIAAGAGLLIAPWLPSVREALGEDAAVAVLPSLHALGGMLAAAGAAALAGRAILFAAAAVASMTGFLLLADPAIPFLDQRRCARAMAEAMREAGLRPGDRVFDASNQVTGIPWYADIDVKTRPGGQSYRVRDVPYDLDSGFRVWVVLKHDPVDARREGRRTAWESVRESTPPTGFMWAPREPPVHLRIVWEGWERVIVTNVP